MCMLGVKVKTGTLVSIVCDFVCNVTQKHIQLVLFLVLAFCEGHEKPRKSLPTKSPME